MKRLLKKLKEEEGESHKTESMVYHSVSRERRGLKLIELTSICFLNLAPYRQIKLTPSPNLLIVFVVVDRFYIALLSALEQTHCTHM